MKIFVLTVIGVFGGDRYSYVIQTPTMDQCYDLVSVEMERNSSTMKVTDAVCNELTIIEASNGNSDKEKAQQP